MRITCLVYRHSRLNVYVTLPTTYSFSWIRVNHFDNVIICIEEKTFTFLDLFMHDITV